MGRPLLQASHTVIPIPGEMEDGWRPASARPSRPSSTGQGGRDSNFSSTLVTFYGQAVYMGDAKKGGGEESQHCDLSAPAQHQIMFRSVVFLTSP